MFDRYIVKIAMISLPGGGGTRTYGQTVTAAELGDTLQRRLRKGYIEPESGSGEAEASQPKKKTKSARTRTALGADFPHGELLQGAGFDYVEDVEAASDEELLSIKKIGKAALRDIRGFKPE